jgi:hypothetical protein
MATVCVASGKIFIRSDAVTMAGALFGPTLHIAAIQTVIGRSLRAVS